MFLEHQISILEWFLKDHVTEDWSNDAENSALHHRNKLLYFWSNKSLFNGTITQIIYFEDNVQPNNWCTPLTSTVWSGEKYNRSQWGPTTVWLPTFFKISSFAFNRRQKFIQVWSNLRLSKWWQRFHFWVNFKNVPPIYTIQENISNFAQI